MTSRFKLIEPGTQFGTLTVIAVGEPIRYRNSSVSTSRCRCAACGQILLVRNDRLRQGRQTSCQRGPCRKSRGSKTKSTSTPRVTEVNATPQPLIVDETSTPMKASAWSTEMFGMPDHVRPRTGAPTAQERKARREYFAAWQARMNAARSAI